MFQVNDYVIYGQMGVCQVKEISIPSFFADQGKLYYTLDPLYQRGTVFIPVDTEVYMRPVMSREEAEELIDMIPTVSAKTYSSSNVQDLNQKYSEKLHSHDIESIISLINSIYLKKQNRQQNNQKIGSVDESYMKRAEMILYGELAVALGKAIEEIPEYIAQRLGK